MILDAQPLTQKVADKFPGFGLCREIALIAPPARHACHRVGITEFGFVRLLVPGLAEKRVLGSMTSAAVTFPSVVGQSGAPTRRSFFNPDQIQLAAIKASHT